MAYTPTVRNMEVSRKDGFSLRAPAWVDTVKLAAGVAQTYTIPAGTGGIPNYAVFSANGDFYAKYIGGAGSKQYDPAGVAAVPTGEITDGSGPELNPTVRYIGGVNTDTTQEIAGISLIAPVDTILTIALYT